MVYSIIPNLDPIHNHGGAQLTASKIIRWNCEKVEHIALITQYIIYWHEYIGRIE